MKLKYFLQILSEFDVESEIEFDVKAIETIEDFGRLSDVYSDDETVVVTVVVVVEVVSKLYQIFKHKIHFICTICTKIVKFYVFYA